MEKYVKKKCKQIINKRKAQMGNDLKGGTRTH